MGNRNIDQKPRLVSVVPSWLRPTILGACALGVWTAYGQMPHQTDALSRDEAEAISEFAKSQYPLRLYPAVETKLDRLRIAVAEKTGVAAVGVPDGATISDGKSIKDRLKRAAASFADRASNKLDKLAVTDREYLIPVLDPYAADSDVVRIASEYGSQEIELSNQIQLVTLRIGTARKLSITAVHDGDGQGVQVVVTTIGGDDGRPVMLPPMKHGETIEVDVL